MTTRPMDTLRDMIALANETGEATGCPCPAFPNVDRDVVTQLLAELAGAVDMIALGMIGPAEEHAGHVMMVALATGYALGAESAYDVVLSTEVIVPDTLAALDVLGDQ